MSPWTSMEGVLTARGDQRTAPHGSFAGVGLTAGRVVNGRQGETSGHSVGFVKGPQKGAVVL